MGTSKKKPFDSTQGDRNKKKRRKVKLPEYSKLNKRLIEEFNEFLEYTPPKRLSRSLRNMFLEFLPHYVGNSVPMNLEETVMDLYFLLEFLDKAAEELEEVG